MTLYNNFLLKRGVGLFSRVGLISGDYGTMIIFMGRLYGCTYDTRWFYSQLLREVTPGILLTPLTDAGDNTIVHLVAAAGNTEMFEVKYMSY